MNAIGIRRLDLLLRAGVALCFIGHGAFGVLRKEEWLPYFALFGMDAPTAYILMPIVGTLDIAVGLLVLAWPTRALLLYGVFWCTFTALLRPLAGESMWETLERAGNYGAPLALLLWLGGRSDVRSWFRRIRSTELEPQHVRRMLRAARWATVALLAGHGMLALSRKTLLVEHVAAIGFGADAVIALGLAELGLAVLCAVRPTYALFGTIVLWKLCTEALFIVTGAPIWEFVERGGSYALPAAAAATTAALLARRHASTGALTDADVLARKSATTGHAGPIALQSAIIGVLLLAAVLTPSQAWAQRDDGRRRALPDSAPSFVDSTAVELRRGGYVLACRHGITDSDATDRHPVRFDDPSTQRILNAAGEVQMRQAGSHIVRTGFPFTDVRTSPYQRTHRSAELMFGDAAIDSALYSGAGRKVDTKALFHSVVARGENRVLMTHQGVLYEYLPLRRGAIKEGDCIMVRPTGSSLEMVAHIRPEVWARYASRR